MDIRDCLRCTVAFCSGSARLRTTLIATACLVSALSLTPAIGADVPDDWSGATQAYERQHFATALAGYERLASRGDCEAAERAGLMLHLGQHLYGSEVPRNADRARRWLLVAAQGGSAVARHLLGLSSNAAGTTACSSESRARAMDETEPRVLVGR